MTVKFSRASAFVLTFASLVSLDCSAVDGLDRHFGSLGALFLSPTPVTHLKLLPYALSIQADGKFVLGGYVVGSVSLPAVGRIDRQGVWDPTFGDHGIYVLPAGSAAAPHGGQVVSLALLSDQRIVFSGSTNTSSGYLAACSLMGALSPAGVPDTGFHAGSAFCYAMPGVDVSGPYFSYADKLLVDAQDRLYFTTNHAFQPGGVARFTAQGAIDTSFGDQGVASLGQDNVGHSLLLPGDGNVYVAASHPYKANVPADSSLRVYKFSAGGAIDSTFGDAGVASYSDTQNQFVAETLDRDDEGRLVLGFSRYLRTDSSDFSHSFQLARFTATGALDSNFNPAGQQPGIAGVALTHPLLDRDTRAFQTQLNADGSLLMVGGSGYAATDESQYLVRLLNDASFDPVFGASATPGRIEAPLSSTHARATGATKESASSVLVVGLNFAAAPDDCGFLTRIVTDQTFNDSFESSDIPLACPSAP